jgi:polyisoprenoid-binding protein YceI
VNGAGPAYRARAPRRTFGRMNTATTDTTTTTWTLDSLHTTVGFSIRHMMITNVRGEFQKVTGTARYDAAHPEAAVIQVAIPAASISTREPQRDAHLKSAAFFDVENHPTITFTSTRVRGVGAGQIEVTGDLTMRGTTREVTLAVNDITGEQKDHQGNQRIGASITGKIKRSDFGITYNMVLEAGGIALSDEVAVTIDIALVKDKAA